MNFCSKHQPLCEVCNGANQLSCTSVCAFAQLVYAVSNNPLLEQALDFAASAIPKTMKKFPKLIAYLEKMHATDGWKAVAAKGVPMVPPPPAGSGVNCCDAFPDGYKVTHSGFATISIFDAAFYLESSVWLICGCGRTLRQRRAYPQLTTWQAVSWCVHLLLLRNSHCCAIIELIACSNYCCVSVRCTWR